MTRNAFSYLIPALVACLLVAGCAVVPGSTLLAMNRIDPLSADPGDIKVAVRAPVGYELGDERVDFSLTLRNKESGETVRVAKAMSLDGGPLPAALLRRETPGTRIWPFSVTPEQRDAILAARETALNWETREANMREMSIAVGTRPCLAPGANPFQEPKFTIFIKPSTEAEWMTLMRESDYFDIVRAEGVEAPEEIRPCDEAGDSASP